jgi:hypothetical protein
MGTRLFPCTFSAVFPYVFPLQIGNTFYVPLHAVGAGLFHLFCDVPIHVQSKGGGMVAQIALDSLDVIPGPKRSDCIAVPLWHNKDKSENPCVASG